MKFYLMFSLFSILIAPLFLVLEKKWRFRLMILIISTMFALAIYNLTGVELGSVSILNSLEEIGLAPIALSEHPYSRIAAFGFLLIGALSLVYGLEVLKGSEQAVSLIAVASAVAIAFSDNFITLFAFWEILTFSTAILIMLKLTPQAIKMGFQFMLFHVIGGLVLLMGIMQHYAAAESFVIAVPQAGLIFFMIGIGFKAAFLPFHVWVAWGYPSASFPASVILAGLTTKVGVYAVNRILPPHDAIVLIGASMAIFGFSCALLQKNMRKLLSYHIISQVGYMVAAAGVASSYGVDGSMLHLVNHMLYKALLFMSAGAVFYATGSENIKELNKGGEGTSPLWKALPVVFVGAVIGALAISGTPGFNGFVSKYLLKKAMYGAGLPETLLLIASVGTVISFCKYVYFGFIKGRAKIIRKPTTTMQMAILTVAALNIILGLMPKILTNLIPYSTSLEVYSVSSVMAASQFLAIGLVVFIVFRKYIEKGIQTPPWLSVEYCLYAPMGKMTYKLCNVVSLLDKNLDNAYLISGKTANKLAEKTAIFDGKLNQMYEKSSESALKLADSTRKFDEGLNEIYEKSGDSARKLAEGTTKFDEGLNDFYEKSGDSAKKLAQGTARFDEGLNDMYEKSGSTARKMAEGTKNFDEKLDDFYQGSGKQSLTFWQKLKWNPAEFNIKNLNFDSLLIAIMLGFFLFVLIYYSRYF